ncbi:MAG: class I SAM-dependent methyltransferase [Rhizobiales bacterium]|nr:class I SAM-dependent methyltransferase [Hyphomicrobiales bacterium]MBI3672401.1 class I SAM-dependent methyltransferase [Hyphomicrobiales bacterium]
MAPQNIYRSQWDRFAEKWRPKSEDLVWPGDEWGTRQHWDMIFRTMFLDYGVADWKNCVEIGAGSGKYTEQVLRVSEARIVAFDISPSYQKVMRERLSAYVASGRLQPAIIEARDPGELIEYLEGQKLVRALDTFYSIDAMVHVDLQYLMAYFMTAALALKENGLMIMTLANAISKPGFKKLLQGVKQFYPMQGQPSAKFEWLSPEIVGTVLANLGFDVTFVGGQPQLESGRDLMVAARLVDLDKAEQFRGYLYWPAGIPPAEVPSTS